jgi:hypothetical protein
LYIKSLGDIASERSDCERARTQHKEALALYERVDDPHSIGWAQIRLARLAGDASEREERLRDARSAWAGIDRPDLLEMLDAELGKVPEE